MQPYVVGFVHVLRKSYFWWPDKLTRERALVSEWVAQGFVIRQQNNLWILNKTGMTSVSLCFLLQGIAVKSKKKKKEKKWSCSSLCLFSLHKHKSLQSAVHCGIEEVPDRSIIVEDYSNEVIGHWPGNMWPRKQTNEIWFRVRLR